MTPLEHLLELRKSVTPGPWRVCPMQMFIFGPDDHMVMEVRGYGAEKAGQRPAGTQEANIEYVTAVVNALAPGGVLDALISEHLKKVGSQG